MLFIFQTSNSFADKAVRRIDGGDWSHVSVGIGKGQVIEAVARHNTVRNRRMDSLLVDRPNHQIILINPPDEEAARKYYLSRVGNKYDYTAIIGLILDMNWNIPNRDYCSELSANGAQEGGLTVYCDKNKVGVNALYENAMNYWGGKIVTDDFALAYQ